MGRYKRADELTPSEHNVASLMALGMTDRAIALERRSSHKTVAHHVHSILIKTGTSSRTAAVAQLIIEGQLDLDDLREQRNRGGTR